MLLLGLAACTSWIDQKPTCKFDVYDWSDDLTAHILAGKGDGRFDYDPEDVPRQQLSGRYGVETGDFHWDVVYGSEYWIQAASVSGFGTAYHDGNLDVFFTESQTDRLGVVTETNHRVYREGCNMVSQSWETGAEQYLWEQSGAYDSDDSFHWQSDISGYHLEGGFRRNHSYTINQWAENGTYEESYAWAPTGKGEGNWNGDCYDTGCTCASNYLRRFDGGLEEEAEITCEGTFFASYQSDVGYDGAGTISFVFYDGSSCELTTQADGSCGYTCSDGSSGPC